MGLYSLLCALNIKAKADKSTIFYVKEIDMDYEGFVEARIEETHLVKSKSISRTSAKAANITNDQNGSVDKEGSFMLYRDDFNELFSDMIEFAINKTRPPHLKFRGFVKPCKMEGSKTDVKKVLKKTEPEIKKKKGPKEKAEKSVTKLNLQIQGETFFTDPEMSIFSVEQYKASVPKFLVAASVNRLLTRSQKIELNPMVVKIKKITDFPSEVFDNTGYTDIFCKFSIPFVAGCTTIEKPIDKTIYFDESHIYFTNHLPKIKLLEYLDSRRFIVEIYGVKRYVTSDITPKIFGENHWDKNIAKVYPNIPKDYTKQFEESQPDYVLLGYCSYDLSSLLRNVWDFRGIAQIHSKECTNFRNISIKNQVPEPYTRSLPVNTINLANINTELNSSFKPVLREWLLMEKGTSLTVEVYLLSPQAPSLVLHQIPNTYKRLMLIALKKQVATQFLSKIWDHNQRIMCQKLDESDLITGFIIDNGNDVIIYIEGLSTGFILNLWNDLNLSNSRQMKIFFNTDQAYENRLYNICSSSCSFYTVILKVPLQHIFKDRRVYVKGNAPLLCWKAITRLHLLLHSQTLTSMLRYELLPSIEELCSLNLEYGVPLTWKLPETDDTASTNTL
ncbi:uncharacterized protein LOC115881837 isoform X2 [Sitophilus oryzae]|uniref:Uncharacterized protein LOC115881837 isoform X2 n=1 Tax=Sitophilus oryzae TaxID=7048 RepID=A0A6J2XWE6_SITOR|nr:uncharacterized protein LOC115881837 isoform X2 [Sitophilus oryzae]